MDSHDLQRRTVLGGTLVAGISLLVGGCKPKQQDGGTGGAQSQSNGSSNNGAPSTPPANPPAGGTGTAPAPSPSPSTTPSAKLSKTQAQYQDMPKGAQMCSNCNHFIASNNTCKVVEGQVSPQGWSILWTAKQPA